MYAGSQPMPCQEAGGARLVARAYSAFFSFHGATLNSKSKPGITRKSHRVGRQYAKSTEWPRTIGWQGDFILINHVNKSTQVENFAP